MLNNSFILARRKSLYSELYLNDNVDFNGGALQSSDYIILAGISYIERCFCREK